MTTIPHLLEWLKYKRLTVPNIGNYVDQLITLIHCWWEYKMIQLLWKDVWQFLIKLSICMSSDSAIPPLGISPKEMKACIHTVCCV